MKNGRLVLPKSLAPFTSEDEVPRFTTGRAVGAVLLIFTTAIALAAFPGADETVSFRTGSLNFGGIRTFGVSNVTAQHDQQRANDSPEILVSSSFSTSALPAAESSASGTGAASPSSSGSAAPASGSSSPTLSIAPTSSDTASASSPPTPSSSVPAAAPAGAAGDSRDDSDVAVPGVDPGAHPYLATGILRWLHNTQNPAGVDCSSAKLMVFATLPGTGFAATLQCGAMSLLKATETGRLLVVDDAGFPYGQWGWYMHHPSVCRMSDVRQGEPIADFTWAPSDARLMAGWCTEAMGRNYAEAFSSVWQPLGLRWWFALLETYLFRLTDDVEARVGGILKEGGVQAPPPLSAPRDATPGLPSFQPERIHSSDDHLRMLCGILTSAGIGRGVDACATRTLADSAPLAQPSLSIAMHVRRGDRLIHDQGLHDWPWYAGKLDALKAGGLPIETLIVASDDAGSLAQAAGTNAVTRVVVVPTLVVRPADASQPMAHFLLASSDEVKRSGGLDVMVAMGMMARGNVFVGLCMSQFGRFTASLVLARGRMVHAPLSPDRDYCVPYWGHYTPVLEGWEARRVRRLQQLQLEGRAAAGAGVSIEEGSGPDRDSDSLEGAGLAGWDAAARAAADTDLDL